jgi:hypothetical protein
MRISVFSGKVHVDWFVVRTRCVAEVQLAEMPLNACPCYVLFSRAALCEPPLPRADTTILSFKGIGKPICRRRSRFFGLERFALDHEVRSP